jgi:hypothetical protein
MCVVCLRYVLRIFNLVICSVCLYVFFVSGSEVPACLSYVFELAIFAFHLVSANLYCNVCGVILWL